jgi:YaiO family outer membrane protein
VRPARRAAVALAALVALGRAAGGATEIEAGYSRETLTNGLPDWKRAYLEAAHHFGARSTLYGLLQETERFSLRDTQTTAGLYFPLGTSWTGLAEAGYSSQHQVLPRSTVYAQLLRSFGAGWNAFAGLRHNEFTAEASDVFTLGAERYWSAWRGAYTLYVGRPEGASSASSHRFDLDRYYGERSSIGLMFVTGRELESVGPPVGLISSDVRAVSLIGRHWISPAWALSYELGAHEQGDLYTRRGGRLGLRYRF